MALESKPLFHPEVIRQQVRSFNLPDRVRDWQPKLEHWAELIASGRADDFKETALLPDSLTDIFCGLLGYSRPAEPTDTLTLSRERDVEVGGKVADAVLGRFQKDKERSRRSSKAREPAIRWTAVRGTPDVHGGPGSCRTRCSLFRRAALGGVPRRSTIYFAWRGSDGPVFSA